MSEKALYRINNRNETPTSFYSKGNIGCNEETKESFFTFDNIYAKEKYLVGKDVNLSEQLDSEDTNYIIKRSKEKQSDNILKNKKNISSYFEPECKLIGEIVNVNLSDKQFTIQAFDSVDEKTVEMIFSYDEVKEIEYKKIVNGQRVIFVYGKQYNNGTVYNSSKLYFRDPSIWSRTEIEKRKKNMAKLFEGIDDEDDFSY